MSISSLFYIIVAQLFFGKTLKLVPISGFVPGLDLFKFLALPVVVGIVSRLGCEARLFRAMFLEEIGKDYVRTARSKGLAETAVLFRHVLRNALAADPDACRRRCCPTPSSARSCSSRSSAFPASAPTSIEAIAGQDFAIVRTMVFLGSLLYIVGLPRDRHRLHLRRPARAARLTTDRTMPKFVFLWTDLVLWLVVATCIVYAMHVRRSADLRATWRNVLQRRAGDVRRRRAAASSSRSRCSTRSTSGRGCRRARRSGRCAGRLRDAHDVAARRAAARLRSRRARRPIRCRSPTGRFSARPPSSTASEVRELPRLVHGGAHLQDPERDWKPRSGQRARCRIAVGLHRRAGLTAGRGRPASPSRRRLAPVAAADPCAATPKCRGARCC